MPPDDKLFGAITRDGSVIKILDYLALQTRQMPHSVLASPFFLPIATVTVHNSRDAKQEVDLHTLYPLDCCTGPTLGRMWLGGCGPILTGGALCCLSCADGEGLVISITCVGGYKSAPQLGILSVAEGVRGLLYDLLHRLPG